MSFTTVAFVAFQLLVLAVWWARPWTVHARCRWLALANVAFYGSLHPHLAVGLVTGATVLWGAGVLVHRRPTWHRALSWALVGGLVVHLVAWKYVPWLVMEHNAWFADPQGWWTVPSWTSPAGLSFLTFHAIVWWRHLVATVPARPGAPEWTVTLAHLGFFPALLAGPVLRAEQVGERLALPFTTHQVRWQEATGLLALGFGCKWVLATQAAQWADPVFAGWATSSGQVWWGVHAYALQIFFDFAGYSWMAWGLAQLMGFTLTQDFDQPYAATSLKDFWRRWHISLSQFFRDQVYQGWFRGASRTRQGAALAAAATLVLSGLWHGAGATFLVWGLWHAAAYLIERAWPGRSRWPAWLGWLVTIQVVVWGWVWFRSPDVTTAWELFVLGWSGQGSALWPGHMGWWVVALFVLVMEKPLRAQLGAWQDHTLPGELPWAHAWGWALGLTAVGVASLAIGPEGVPAFIYAGF